MKKAVLYIFSGTGNTRTAAGFIAESLRRRGFEAVLWEARVPFDGAPDPNEFDLALFGYPVHAFNTPRFFLRFVKSLPDVSGCPAYIFKTSGEPLRFNSASSRPLVRLLAGKGFAPMLDRHLLMPYNIVFRYHDALVKQMYLHTRDMAALIATAVAGETEQKLRYNPFTVLLLYLFRLQWLGAWLNGPLVHPDRTRCTGCGRCAMACPAQNIRMRGGFPKFSSRCTMCMRCAFCCPTDAVRTGFLNRWRVNGPYPFEKLAADKTVPATFIDENTKGYFRLFRKYYRETYAEIEGRRARAAADCADDSGNVRTHRDL